MNARELRAQRAQYLDKAEQMVLAAEAEDRDFAPEEKTKYDQLVADAKALEERIKRQESLQDILPAGKNVSVLKLGRGDDENRALGHFIKTGDMGGVRSLIDPDENSGKPEVRVRIPTGLELRSTAEIMNVAADADGKSAVPTGFSGKIAARRSEVRLAERLGCQFVPGIGTTVNYPYENADAAVFAATSEQIDNLSNTYDEDRPTLTTKAFTLAKKTKKLILTEELLEDEDANLLGFVADHIGRAIGLTHNTALLVEAAASGTSVTLGAAAAATAGDPEKFAYHATLGYYLDDGSPAAWVMRPPTFGAIKNITGTSRLYDEQTGGSGRRTLMEYPVYYSNAAAAIAASAKSMYFGNWFFMGLREGPSINLIRDPYTTDGVTILKYSFRLVYGVLIAGAIGYGAHPSA